MATLSGSVFDAKFTPALKELAEMAPGVDVFLKTEIFSLVPTISSGFPSPSRSPDAILRGVALVLKSTFGANELVVIAPGVLVFRNIEIVFVELTKVPMTSSGFPSPSRSPM